MSTAELIVLGFAPVAFLAGMALGWALDRALTRRRN